MFLPVSSDFKYACFIAFELPGKFFFGAGVVSRAGELKCLQRKERTLELGFQDIDSFEEPCEFLSDFGIMRLAGATVPKRPHRSPSEPYETV